MKKVWKYRAAVEENDVKHLSAALNVDMTLSTLLVQRGVKTFQQAKQFFNPSLDDLHDPFLMHGMDIAVERLHRAIVNDENILVYGDYDVDGTSSVALVSRFLKNRVTNLESYIPDRYIEGYGISMESIEYSREKNISLVIVLDCGIKAIEQIRKAKEYGIDYIICDHHNPGDTVPDAVAVLDPKQECCNYPFKELSGCGVGFKFIEGYCIKHNIDREIIYKNLDLVAVSIASDIVSVVGENRILAHFGLKQINSAPCEGLKVLIQTAGIRGEITFNDIIYKIGPRLNASGRIEKGLKSVEMMLTDKAEDARRIGSEIESFNEIRKKLDRDTTEEALDIIQKDPFLIDRSTTVLFNRYWHKGVVGIIASRLTEKYFRPTIILTESNGLATGSARSVGRFDLYSAVEQCSDLLETFGGHTFAIGLTMKIENVSKFTERLEAIVSKSISDDDLVDTVTVDSRIGLSDITPKFSRILKQLAPHGPNNLQPTFITKNVINAGGSFRVGQKLEHLKLELIEANRSSSVYQGIAFYQGDQVELISNEHPFDICYNIQENRFRGKNTIQLNVKSMRSSQFD